MSSPPRTTGVDTRSVFLSAALDTDIEPAKAMLAASGFESIQWTQLPAEGLATGLPETLKTCDALVAIIDDESVAPAVLLEVGAALGRGLPVVVLTMSTAAAEALPPVLRELTVVAVHDNRSAAGIRLAETLHALLDARNASLHPLARAPRPSRRPFPSEGERIAPVEKVIVDYLLSQGARVVKRQPRYLNPEGYYFRPDLAFWIDALPSPAFNPVLVEIKGWSTANDSGEVVHGGVDLLRLTMGNLGCVLGLVVTMDAESVAWRVDEKTAIASVGVDVLTKKNLMQLLHEGRNRWVHGRR